MRRVYFDHLAATPLLPEAFAAMRPFFREHFGNPSSPHRHGLRARDALNEARARVAALIRAASPDEIFFTSGGTEATNLALKGAAYALRGRGNHLVVSAIEHPAVLRSIEFLETRGFTCTRVGVDGEGRVDPEEYRTALTDQTILLGLHLANHDLGTIQPAAEVGRIAAERGLACFMDATTCAGWLPIDVRALGANLLSLAPHRFYGPKGVGVLYRNRRARLVSLLHGGDQEGGWRAGTENVPAIVGAGVAAEAAARELDARMAHTRRLQRRLWDGLRERVPCLRFNGPPPGPERLATNLNFCVEFVEGEGLLLLCDMNGIALASGSGCVSKSLPPAPALEAIGVPPSLARGNLILTLGRDNSDADVDYFLDVFADKVVPRLRGMSPAWEQYQRGERDSLTAPRQTPDSSTS